MLIRLAVIFEKTCFYEWFHFRFFQHQQEDETVMHIILHLDLENFVTLSHIIVIHELEIFLVYFLQEAQNLPNIP